MLLIVELLILRQIKTLDDLKWLIETKVKENLYLEYKREITSKKLTKTVSAFANSNGGQLIIGIDEENDIAKEIIWIEENNYRQTLDSWIIQKMDPSISIFHIERINNPNNQRQSVFVISINKSKNSPHMAEDKKYYKRSETQSIAMMDFEVKEAIFRSGLLAAFFQELKDNKELLEHFKSVIGELKHKYPDTPADKTWEMHPIIYPFKIESWRAILHSGLISSFGEETSELIELYNLLLRANHLIDYLKYGFRRVSTFEKPQGGYILSHIEGLILVDIYPKMKKIIDLYEI